MNSSKQIRSLGEPIDVLFDFHVSHTVGTRR